MSRRENKRYENDGEKDDDQDEEDFDAMMGG